MKPTRRQFLVGSSVAVAAAGALPLVPAQAATNIRPNANLLGLREYRVAPTEVHALIARLEAETGAPVWTEGDRLILQSPQGPESFLLRLILTPK